MRVFLVLRSPQFGEQLGLCHHASGVAQQHRQQRPFLAAEHQRCALERDQAAAQVDAQIAVVEYGRAFAVGALPEQHAQTRRQLLHAEGFGHVIVGAGIERRDLLAFLRTHRQHHHRYGRPGAQFAQNLHAVHAVHVGQAEVEDDQVRIVVGGDRQTLAALAGLVHLVALRAQTDLQHAPDLRFVVDDQQRMTVRHGYSLGESAGGKGSGSTMRMVAPRPSAPGKAFTVPPCAATMPWQIDNPSPVPGLERSLRSPRSTE